MKNICLFLALLLIYPVANFAQVKGLSPFDGQESIEKQLDLKNSLSDQMKSDKMPVGNIVDPKFYKVGPGDLLSIYISPILPTDVQIMVTPQVSIIVPRIGEINLQGKTLEQVKDTITKIALSRNPNANCSVSLRQARMCLVTISGNVIFPGAYTVPASYRISTAIKFANQTKSGADLSINEIPAFVKLKENMRERERTFSETGMAPYASYSTRNIRVMRDHGPSQIADIEKAKALEDPTYDPFIQEGDEIFIPFDGAEYPKISISGAVQRPAVLAYKYGDKASTLLKMGFGFAQYADLHNIQLVVPGKENVRLSCDSVMNLLCPDYDLLPGSSIIVGKVELPEISENGVVSVSGQVNSPGIYLIKANQTRLKDVIKMAGGFNDKAYLPLASITRRDRNQIVMNEPKMDIWTSFQYSDLTFEDSSRFFIDMMLKKPIVSCDFVNAFEHDSASANILIRDGDVITIPANPGKVFIFGQVNQPGFIDYIPNQNMEWYVQKAGGYAQGADEERARIIRGNNKVWVKGEEDVFVYGGDEIYIPHPPDVPPSLKAQQYGTLAAVIGALVGAAGLLYSIFGKK